MGGIGLDEIRLDRAGGAGDKHQWRRRTKVRRALAPVAKQIPRHRGGTQADVSSQRINAPACHEPRSGRVDLCRNGKRGEGKAGRQRTIREQRRRIAEVDRAEERTFEPAEKEIGGGGRRSDGAVAALREDAAAGHHAARHGLGRNGNCIELDDGEGRRRNIVRLGRGVPGNIIFKTLGQCIGRDLNRIYAGRRRGKVGLPREGRTGRKVGGDRDNVVHQNRSGAGVAHDKSFGETGRRRAGAPIGERPRSRAVAAAIRI